MTCREYLQSKDADEKESKLFQLVPLFNKTCSIIDPKALVDKFEEIFDFAENVTFFFVRHVTQLAQNGPAALLEYFEQDGDNPSAGITFLKGIVHTANFAAIHSPKLLLCLLNT